MLKPKLMCASGPMVYDGTGGALNFTGGTPITLDGATVNGNKVSVLVTDPTAGRTLTIPNADSVTTQPSTCAGGQVVSGVSAAGGITCKAPDGLVCTGCVDATDIATLAGATPIVFDGATVNGNKTTLTVTDPTGARTFTLPDANSVAVQPVTCGGGQTVTAVSSLGALTCSAVSSSVWSALTNPSGNLSLGMNNTNTTFTWGNATGAATDMMTLADAAGNSGSGAILNVKLGNGSSAQGLQVTDTGSGSVFESTGTITEPFNGGLLMSNIVGGPREFTAANGLNSNIAIMNDGAGGLGVEFTNYVHIIGPTGAFSIDSVAQSFGGQLSGLLILYNDTAQNMTVKHNTGAGTKFFFTNAADHTTTGRGTMTFIYDPSNGYYVEIAEQL